jgi:predicted transcriptional regulator
MTPPSLVAQTLLNSTGSVPAAVAAIQAQLSEIDTFWSKEQRRQKAITSIENAQYQQQEALKTGMTAPRSTLLTTESFDNDTAMDELAEVSTSITQTWTDQAIKCYVTKSDCDNCSIPRGHYSFACQMNKVVPALLSSMGRPDSLRLEKLTPYLDQY